MVGQAAFARHFMGLRLSVILSCIATFRLQKLINNLRTIATRWRPVIEALHDDKQSPTEQKPNEKPR